MRVRWPGAKKLRRRIGGVLLDVQEIRPGDLVVGDRVVVDDHGVDHVRIVRALEDVESADPAGGRYRYLLTGETLWRSAHPVGWIRIVVDS